jgi:membrane protein
MMTSRLIAPIHGCWDEKILSRTMVSNVSAAVPVPPGRNAQERSIRAVFIFHGNAAPSDGADMWWTVVKEAATNWSSHKDARQGAALAYYSVFSLGPIIVIAVAVAGLLFGRDAVTAQVMSSIKEMLGDTGAKAVEAMLAGASRPTAGILATILGIGALLFAAIGVVVQLKDALNVVWEAEESKQSGLWHFARSYVLSFAAVLTLGFLLLVSLVVSAGLAAAGKYVAPYMPEGALHVINMLISFVVVMVLFAMMFKWLPDVSVGWRDVWPGAFLTALFFEIGKAAIGFYIGKQGLESTYGAAASIVVVLIWVYYTSQIILMGAEVTHSYAKQNGSLKKFDRGKERQAA